MNKKLKKFKAERHLQSKIWFWVIVFFIFFIPNISAWEIDNVKSYDASTQTITIKNAFGLPIIGDDIAKITLNTPTNYYVMRGENKLVAEFTIDNYAKDYSEALKNLEFYNLNLGGKKFEREFVYKYKVVTPITESYERGKCLNQDNKDCDNKVIEYEKENVEWVVFNEKSELPIGEITIGIFTDVYSKDKVEWIPTLFGERITEWARWTASLDVDLEAYYQLNSSLEDVLGMNNLTASNAAYIEYGTYPNSFNATWDAGGQPYFMMPYNVELDIEDEDWTLNVWGSYSGNTTPYNRVFTSGSGAFTDTYLMINNYQTSVQLYMTGDSCSDTRDTVEDEWIMYSLITNQSDVNLYINGVYSCSADRVYNETGANPNVTYMNFASGASGSESDYVFNGTLDEVGFWSRRLSDSEMVDLYNGGVGITWGDYGSTTLNFPSDGYNISSTSVEFNSTSRSVLGDLVNTSLFIWNPDTTLYTKETTTITGTINETINSITSIPIANEYLWGVETCVLGECYMSTNRTLNIKTFLTDVESYSSTSRSGNTESFQINLSAAGQISTANLYYNNTNYSGTITNIVDYNYSILTGLTTPTVDSNTNISFYWDIIINGGYRDNSTEHNQSISGFNLDDCILNSELLYNFTHVDEKTQERLEPSAYNNTIKLNLQMYNLDRSLLIFNFSTLYNATNESSICLESNLTASEFYSLDAQLQYDANSYASEFYNIQNQTINSDFMGKNVTLYDLDDIDSEQFVISYRDESFLPVESALIQIQRKYIDEGLFKTVEVPITDNYGETLAHLEKSDAIYTFIVVKYGKVLATFSNQLATCESVVLGDCKISLNNYGSNVQPADFTELEDLTFTLTYNETSRLVQTIFTIPSSTTSDVLLNVTLNDAFGVSEVCSDNLVSSSGTLSCTVPSSFGNGSAVVKIYVDDNLRGSATIALDKKAGDIYGASQIFIGLLLLLTIIGIAISSSPIITLLMFLVGAILLVTLNIVDTTAYIGTGAAILWLFVAVICVIVKGNRREI